MKKKKDDIRPGSIVYWNIKAKEWRKFRKGTKTSGKIIGVMVEPPHKVMTKSGFCVNDHVVRMSPFSIMWDSSIQSIKK